MCYWICFRKLHAEHSFGVKLHGAKQSNIGFTIYINKTKPIEGILSPTGKILKITGANSLKGKHWDDLAKELVQ